MHEHDERLPNSRLPAAAWALLAAAAMSAHAMLPSLLFTPAPDVRPAYTFLVFFHGCCAVLVCAVVGVMNPWLAGRYPERLAPRLFIGLALVAALCAACTLLMFQVLYPALTARVAGHAQYALGYRACMVAVFVVGWLLMRQHANVQTARALALRIENDELRASVDATGLVMLEAQIEPHFLFNTLAHIKRLYRVDASAADHVMRDLIAYLGRSLPALSRTDWRISDEVELVTLYLNLIAQRFCDRLRFSVDVAADAGAFQLPALTVATLVENAVRHGLGPKAGAGHVSIQIVFAGHDLVIEVVDDGVGLRQTSGNGVGLATVRARLRRKFGDGASLRVAPAEAGGVRAVIRVPQGRAHV